MSSSPPKAPKALRADSEQRGLRACGEQACRVCVALGFLRAPASRPRLRPRLPGKTHPLNTARALARAERVHEALLQYELEHGGPPTNLGVITCSAGFARSGLLSRYMQRLEQDGLVCRVPSKKRGRFKFSWSAVAAVGQLEQAKEKVADGQ